MNMTSNGGGGVCVCALKLLSSPAVGHQLQRPPLHLRLKFIDDKPPTKHQHQKLLMTTNRQRASNRLHFWPVFDFLIRLLFSHMFFFHSFVDLQKNPPRPITIPKCIAGSITKAANKNVTCIKCIYDCMTNSIRNCISDNHSHSSIYSNGVQIQIFINSP